MKKNLFTMCVFVCVFLNKDDLIILYKNRNQYGRHTDSNSVRQTQVEMPVMLSSSKLSITVNRQGKSRRRHLLLPDLSH